MLESLLEALKFSPNNVALKLQIAKLYAQNGDYTNCEKQLYECIDLDSTHKDAKYELANCFYKQGKTSAAEVLLEEITKNSNNIKYLELLCYCQLKQDNYNDAQDTYKDILTIDHSYINEDFDRKLKITTTYTIRPANL